MIWNITRDKTDTAVAPRMEASWESEFARGRAEGYAEAASAFSGLTPSEARRKVRSLRKEIKQHDRSLKDTRGELDNVAALLVAAEDLSRWSESFLTFQRPARRFFGELREAVYSGAFLDMNDWKRRTSAEEYEQELFADANVFVIEHDWWSAVNKAEDFDQGSFRLPFDICIFEFVISGKPVIALTVNYGELVDDPSKNEILMQIATKSLVGWTLSGTIYSNTGGAWESRGRHLIDGQTGPILNNNGYNLIRIIGDQIKAACVALEAEIAIANVVRLPGTAAPHERVPFPPVEYRVISLRRKARPPELPSGEGRKGKRLHFRRGHWRHLPNFKTWVRWTMVGDPDLGFIEKEYRL
jgi:hypothetical protein